jgi:hypothetical protein
MIHTYRDPDADARPPGVALPLVFILVGVALVSWFVSGRNTSSVPFAAFGLLWCGGFLLARRQRHRTCREIRLDDDGTCELHTEGRVVPLHVHQIRTVRYHPATDESSERYTIQFDGGKVDVHRGMSDFRDFLERLKTLNPAVDLSTFPMLVTEGLSGGAGSSAPQQSSVERFLRSAFFPLFVIVLVIWLAGQTVVK